MLNITYKNLREKIINSNKVWVFFTASDWIFSEWIRLWTQQNVSHVGFFLYFGKRLWIVEMMLNEGCIIMPASARFLSEKNIKVGCFTDREMTEDLQNKILESVWKVQYDLIWAFFSLFVDTKSSKEFCSEFVTKILWLEFPSLDRWVFPGDVMNKCNKIYNLIR